jgi:hypothetical protein
MKKFFMVVFVGLAVVASAVDLSVLFDEAEDWAGARAHYVAAARQGHGPALEYALEDLLFRADGLRWARSRQAWALYQEAKLKNPDLGLYEEATSVGLLKVCADCHGGSGRAAWVLDSVRAQKASVSDAEARLWESYGGLLEMLRGKVTDDFSGMPSSLLVQECQRVWWRRRSVAMRIILGFLWMIGVCG